MSQDHPIPAWKVTLDGQDLTERMRPRLLDLTLTECRSEDADQLDLRVHDHDGALALPKRGVELAVAIGWQDGGLIDKGKFTVDEVEHSGAPDILTIRARSANMTKQLRSRRDRSWHDVTLGAVLRNLAGEHGLTPRIAAQLASIALPHLDQAGESDAALLARLGREHDAVATVKAGALIFAPIGSGTTATGQPLPGARITRASGDGHRYAIADRDGQYSGVRAHWHDTRSAKRKTELVGGKDNAKTLRGTSASAEEAKRKAQAEWDRIQRGTALFSINLALGRADLYPEQKIRVEGFKPEIDGTQWLVKQVAHSITGSAGFTTTLELETALN